MAGSACLPGLRQAFARRGRVQGLTQAHMLATSFIGRVRERRRGGTLLRPTIRLQGFVIATGELGLESESESSPTRRHPADERDESVDEVEGKSQDSFAPSLGSTAATIEMGDRCGLAYSSALGNNVQGCSFPAPWPDCRGGELVILRRSRQLELLDEAKDREPPGRMVSRPSECTPANEPR
ncbi:hypothetical protein B0A49_01570 [Cryomyces minteri]|uniref:Uncharacterized protein n=1 Tax=Cryomyces minteri TaxID=331657 RepID=A0A4U0XQM3_9PEZI|nr:hypothetical protein B0A49_01570 [Cryomyces minteri]